MVGAPKTVDNDHLARARGRYQALSSELITLDNVLQALSSDLITPDTTVKTHAFQGFQVGDGQGRYQVGLDRYQSLSSDLITIVNARPLTIQLITVCRVSP